MQDTDGAVVAFS